MRLSRVGHENCAPATFPLPLSSIHGYGYDLATVAVLIMLLDGDLIDVFGDFEARRRQEAASSVVAEGRELGEASTNQS